MRILLVPTSLDLHGIPAAVALRGPHCRGKISGNVQEDATPCVHCATTPAVSHGLLDCICLPKRQFLEAFSRWADPGQQND